MEKEFQSLGIVQSITDGKLEQIENINRQILSDSRFSPFKINNVNLAMEAIKTLQSYTGATSIAHNIVLSFPDDPYFYHSGGSVMKHPTGEYKDRFLNSLLPLFNKTIDFQNLPRAFPLQQGPAYGGSDEYIAFAYPLPSPKREALLGTAIIFVDRNIFLNPIEKNGKEQGPVFFFANPAGDIVLSSKQNEVDTLQLLLPSEMDSQEAQRTIVHGKEKYLLSTLTSDRSGWTYYSLTPLTKVMEHASALRVEMLIGLGIILVLAFFIIARSLQINYFPIRELQRYARDILKKEPESRDKLSAVKYAMDYLSSQNTMLVQHSYSAAYEHILFNLIRGRYTPQEFESVSGEYDISFAYPLFQVITLQGPQNFAGQERRQKLEDLLKQLSLHGWVLDGLSRNSSIIILNFPLDYNMGQLFQEIHAALFLFYQDDITIGTGNITKEIQDIPTSYLNSIYALDYRFIQGNHAVISYHDIVLDKKTVPQYPYKELEKLDHLLHLGETLQVEQQLELLQTFLKKPETSLLMARRLSSDIIDILAKAVNRLNLSGKEEHNFRFHISDFESVDELLAVVQNISVNICRAMRNIQQEEQSLLEKINVYLNKYFTEYSFAVQNIADVLEMQVSYISQYYRKETGKTIQEELIRLRVEHAIHLLMTTDLSVKEVAEQVGYASDSSFIRRFKTHTGLTPGQYVKYHQEKKEGLPGAEE